MICFERRAANKGVGNVAYENPIQSTLGTSNFAAYEEEVYAKHQENAEKEIVETVQNLFSIFMH